MVSMVRCPCATFSSSLALMPCSPAQRRHCRSTGARESASTPSRSNSTAATRKHCSVFCIAVWWLGARPALVWVARASGVGRSRLRRALAAAAEQQHHDAEPQQHYSPTQVDINAERALVNGAVAHAAKDGEDEANQREQKANRNANVNSHGHDQTSL